MKKRIFSITLSCMAMAMLFGLGYTVSSCKGAGTGSDSDSATIADDPNSIYDKDGNIKMVEITVTKEGNYQKTYNIADIEDNAAIYNNKVNKANCFIVISKKEYRLYVYEVAKGDTVLAAHFPVCYARNKENKQGNGDYKTPECTMDNPFTISQIVDATTWCHDFGWGNLPAYGHYFMRLVTPPHTGIGIHGSTGNAESVPGRDSEGCIRLRDADIITLHDLFAQENMKVVVKGYTIGKLPFEEKAEKALGEKYKAPKKGNPFAKGAKPNAANSQENANVEHDPADAPTGKIK